MTKKHDEERSSREEAFEVGFFRPEDAEGIVSLFRTVYGDDYPIRIFTIRRPSLLPMKKSVIIPLLPAPPRGKSWV